MSVNTVGFGAQEADWFSGWTHVVEMLDDVAGQTLLGADQHLDHFVEVERRQVVDVHDPGKRSENIANVFNSTVSKREMRAHSLKCSVFLLLCTCVAVPRTSVENSLLGVV